MLYREKRAFTLLEMFLAIAISVFIVWIATRFIIQGFRASSFAYEQETAMEQARKVMDPMIKDIRGANSSTKGAYLLAEINPQSFSFYSDIDDDGQTEKVRYYLEETILKQELIEPGATDDYDGEAVVSELVHYVNNQAEPIFYYYDADYNQTSTINNIRLIKIRLDINVHPERAPEDHWAESEVQLRNLKDNL